MHSLTHTEPAFFSTMQVTDKDRSAYWNDMVCDVYVELDCDNFRERDFFGKIEKYDVEGLELSKVITDPHHVIRSNQQISKSLDDCFLLSLQLAGRCSVSQDGREAFLSEGDFALYDATRPYKLCFPDQIEQVVLKIPRRLMASHVTSPETMTAIRIAGDQGLGRISSRLLKSLGNQVQGLPATVYRPVVNNTLGLVAAALCNMLDSKQPDIRDQSEYRRTLLFRVKSHIMNNLDDTELGVERLSADLRLSSRYLHSLFESENTTLTRWIWSKRLECARKDLLDPCHLGTSITQICYKWGFKDTAHFSRAYKKKFDTTPRSDRNSVKT